MGIRQHIKLAPDLVLLNGWKYGPDLRPLKQYSDELITGARTKCVPIDEFADQALSCLEPVKNAIERLSNRFKENRQDEIAKLLNDSVTAVTAHLISSALLESGIDQYMGEIEEKLPKAVDEIDDYQGIFSCEIQVYRNHIVMGILYSGNFCYLDEVVNAIPRMKEIVETKIVALDKECGDVIDKFNKFDLETKRELSRNLGYRQVDEDIIKSHYEKLKNKLRMLADKCLYHIAIENAGLADYMQSFVNNYPDSFFDSLDKNPRPFV